MVGFVDGAGPHAFVSAGGDGRGRLNVYVSRQLQLPAAPTAVRSVGLRGGIRLTWQAVPDAARYEVWRVQPSARIGSPAAATFLDAKAPRGKAVRYRVRAVNAVGAGPFAPPVLGRRR